MDFISDEAMAWILDKIVFGTAAAGIAYWLFQTLSSRWLENKFSQKLEQFRHDNAKDLERLRLVANGTLNARVRLQEKEFEIVGEIWGLLHQAMGEAHDFISPFQQYSDLKRMNPALAKEFLQQYNFLPAQVDEIMDSPDRNDAFFSAVFWWKRNKAFGAISNFNNLVVKNEIFLEEDVASSFIAVSKKLREAAITFEVAKESVDRKLGREAWDKLNKECEPEINVARLLLRKRFGKVASIS